MRRSTFQSISNESKVMKNILAIACILFSFTSSIFGQKISETNLSLGFSKTTAPLYKQYWDDTPTYLVLNASKSWHNNDHWLSLRKEAGFNLQYSKVNLESGGLGASNHLTGSITSLFANATLQARFRINSSMAFGLGPEAEILLIGLNNLNDSYQTILTKPPSMGNNHQSGFNRDYFNKPAYGIKLSLFETGISEKTTLGINVSYLWTKSELSDFYASNYTRISFFIGFIKQKKELPPDPLN